MTVADYIAKFLISKNVKHIFGYQGGAILKILDAIIGTKKIEYIQNFNEQASAFCANAYARIRNDIGVAVATSGPGATNLISGIADAYFDSIPVLFITGQDYLDHVTQNRNARQNGFQDLDIISMVKPISKYATLISNPETIKYELEKAYHIAISNRKGPVVLDIPIDIQFQKVVEENLIGFTLSQPEKSIVCDIEQFIHIIKNSQKPVILAGGGVRSADCIEDFKHFIEKVNIPVITTLNGIDLTDSTYGFSGLYGHSCCNKAIKNAELIIALGVRFGQHQIGKSLTNYTNAKVIRVEIDDNEIGRSFIKEDFVLKIHLKKFFDQINKNEFNINFNSWHKQLTDWNIKYKDTVCNDTEKVDPVTFVREVGKYYKDDTIITTDVGANQMWVAQGYKQKNHQRFLTSSGFGAMGFSLPAAIGASYLTKTPIVAYMGDGGLQMNLQELNTLAIRRNNVKCVIFNNNTLGLMRLVQNRYYNDHYYGTTHTEFTCPNLQKLAECFNLKYANIKDNKDFFKLKDVFADSEPYLVEVNLDTDLEVLNRYDDISLNDG